MTELELIKKGFNHGYELQRLDANLVQSIVEGLSDGSPPYIKGFVSGVSEQIKEQNLKIEKASLGEEKGLNIDL